MENYTIDDLDLSRFCRPEHHLLEQQVMKATRKDVNAVALANKFRSKISMPGTPRKSGRDGILVENPEGPCHGATSCSVQIVDGARCA